MSSSSSTFDSLVADLSRDAHRVQPKDALQFCANWFQTRLEEQRARTRDVLARRTSAAARDLPSELYMDSPLGAGSVTGVSPFSPAHRHSFPVHRPSIAPPVSPFGTLNVPGNALLSNSPIQPLPPTVQIDPVDPTPLPGNSLASYDIRNHTPHPGDFLQPSATILARRTSVSAESILVDGDSSEPIPVFPKSPEQLSRIKSSIKNNFIFRDLDDEQATGVLNAMQEVSVPANDVVIRQGDEGEYFYVVESGLLHCFIKPDALPPASVTAHGAAQAKDGSTDEKDKNFVAPNYHAEFGQKVAECPPGTSFGELALMYGHPHALST
jgi:cAMP-dependent protein kinase regulator